MVGLDRRPVYADRIRELRAAIEGADQPAVFEPWPAALPSDPVSLNIHGE